MNAEEYLDSLETPTTRGDQLVRDPEKWRSGIKKRIRENVKSKMAAKTKHAVGNIEKEKAEARNYQATAQKSPVTTGKR